MIKTFKSLPFIILTIFLITSFQINAQWTEQTSPTVNALYSVSVVDNNVAWIGGAAGTVLRSTNSGGTWTSVGGGAIGSDDIYNIFGVDAQTALCTTSPLATYIYRTTNGGSTWTQVLSVTGGFMDAIWMTDANNGIAYGDPVSGNWELYKTTDGGATWNALPALAQSGSEAGWNNAMYVSGSDIYFGTNNTRIYYSSDMGNSWAPQTTTGELNSYAIWFNDANIGLMGGSTAGLDKTTNGGTTWTPITSPGATASAGLTGADGQWLFATQANPGVIYYSTDAGANWTTSYTAPTGQFYHMAKARNGTLVIAVQSDGGISSNSTLIVPVELTSFTANVTEQGYVSLNWSTATETNNHLFEIERRTEQGEYFAIGYVNGAGTTTEPQNYSYVDNTVQSGKYFYRLKQVDFDGRFEYSNEVEVDVATPLSFNLEQNYPNPFNPTTKIKYSIPEAGNITLSVYNTVGQEVAILLNGHSEAGNFEVSFDASNLPSGVYLYKLQSANSVQTKKMMLLK
jgi:photosystem II stability/assembly factor-like uncharacterized protein